MSGKSKQPQGDLFARSTERTWTVSELTSGVRALLEDRFGLVRVVGELSGLTRASSGHAYFQLKDDRATLEAVCFRNSLARLGGELPAAGEQVECLGRLTLYEPRGRTQLVVEWLAPKGEGALAIALARLKACLQAEGLFDANRKRALPAYPRAIGVVTSPSGAALRDILQVLGRRFPAVPVWIAPVRVQGEGAAEEIAAAIGRLGDGRHGEVLIVGRGGGSAEDLWAFNAESVVRAIAACPVPVVSAVGHETDWVLADLAADLRAPTPSAAAELVVPDREELASGLRERAAALRRLLRLRSADERGRLLAIGRRLRDPRLVVAAGRMRLDEIQRDLRAALGLRLAGLRRRWSNLRVELARFEPQARLRADRDRLRRGRTRLTAAAQATSIRRRLELRARADSLAGLSPLAVLDRGYALVTGPDGQLARDAVRIAAGDVLDVRLSRGQLETRVTRSIPVDPEKDENTNS